MTPDAIPTDLHISLSALVPWLLTLAGAVGAGFFGLWNRAQSGDIKGLADSIRALTEAHESQEKRFDERERTIKHELGASIGVAIARADKQDERLAAAIEGMNACQKAHLQTGVRHEHITEIKEGIREIFGRLVTIEKSMAAFHAKHGGEE